MTIVKLDTVQDDANKLNVKISSSATDAEVTVNQDTPAECQVEPVQTNPAELEVTINQGTASECQVEPVQTDPAQLAVTTTPVVPTVTTTINATTMDADITSATAISLGSAHCICVQIKTTQGVAAPDHVGVVKFKVANTSTVGDADELAVPQVVIAAGAEVSETVEFTTYAPYLWVFYDRTSGGADDTITVTVAYSP